MPADPQLTPPIGPIRQMADIDFIILQMRTIHRQDAPESRDVENTRTLIRSAMPNIAGVPHEAVT